MFCPYCGNSCDDTHKFCFRCGKPLPELSVAELSVAEISPEEPVAAEEAEAIIPVPGTEETVEILSDEQAAEETEIISDTPNEPVPAEDPEPVPDSATVDPFVPEPQPKKGRLWPPILALCLMICIGLSAFFLFGGTAEEPSCFSIENGVLYFDYSRYTGANELTVPDTVDGMAVIAISDGCFQDCDRLTTVILPETITVIGDNAFANCDSLRGIYIPNGVLSVGTDALVGCPALEAVCFPASVAEIGAGCLNDCESLQYIFYDGTYAQWMELYEGTYPSGMELHTNDGVYYAQP